MSRATKQRRRAEREAQRGSGMSAGWWVACLSFGTLVALIFAANAKDIKRYIKISSM